MHAPQDKRNVENSKPVQGQQARGLTSYHAGQSAEEQVARLYKELGYRILATRWRTRRGELDLVAAKGRALVFVEVKKSRDHNRALARVSPAQVNRLYQTAEAFLATLDAGTYEDMRFDVATVDATGTIRRLENAIGFDVA